MPMRPAKGGGGTAEFGAACAECTLAAQCTNSTTGRNITIGGYEAELTRARAAQDDPAWGAEYRATRPKVERKIAHRCATGTAADVHGSAARPRSPPTSLCSTPRSTWPVWACRTATHGQRLGCSSGMTTETGC